jgi:hypothetical protein
MPTHSGSSGARSALAVSQGAYFFATGIWPLLHMRSFERVTGPKVDKWLVRTVGVLVTVIGGVLCSAGARNATNSETMGLAIGSAAGLGAIDVIYGSSGRISRIYLADAAIEGALICAWMVSAVKGR